MRKQRAVQRRATVEIDEGDKAELFPKIPFERKYMYNYLHPNY